MQQFQWAVQQKQVEWFFKNEYTQLFRRDLFQFWRHVSSACSAGFIHPWTSNKREHFWSEHMNTTAVSCQYNYRTWAMFVQLMTVWRVAGLHALSVHSLFGVGSLHNQQSVCKCVWDHSEQKVREKERKYQCLRKVRRDSKVGWRTTSMSTWGAGAERREWMMADDQVLGRGEVWPFTANE